MIEFENLLKTTKLYKTIISDKNNGSLSHCNMIVSEDEVACRLMCDLVARALLCKNDNCGVCKDCMDVENGVHSGLVESLGVRADDIRTLISSCYKEVEGDTKVVLIKDFQNIDPREQNKLLKLLEEPGANTIFVIGVTQISAVLETIKSRATKMVIEPFDDIQLQQALIEKGFELDNVLEAIKFAEGSITNAVNILSNDGFIDSYNAAMDILINMEKSTMMLDNYVKFKIRNKDRATMINNANVCLSALEIILKQTLEYSTNQNINVDDSIKTIALKYSISSLVNMEELIIEARKKININGDVEGTITFLLMKILEVRYKCQK